MAKTVAIGIQEFEQLREQNAFYVDKTKFISEWWDGGDAVTLITRPRRFGKTLNMSMIECFFSTNYKGRSDLFEGLDIWKQEKYRNMQGTYPVIFLSFADIKEDTYEDAYYALAEIITQAYNQNDFLLDSDILNENEKKQFQSVCVDMPKIVASKALKNLSGYLTRYYGKKVIIILDEYDTPMQEAYINGYWDELIGFTRNLFNSTFKTNQNLERAILTGITRVSKESIFSDFNNPKVVTTTTPKYEDCFGFTQEEVDWALEDRGMEEYKEDVKKWYDGFRFGEISDIYNPWSIINFLKDQKFETYWANTSSNGLVSKLIQSGDKEVKYVIGDLLRGKTLCTMIDEQVVFSQLNGSIKAIWSLLVASGYLKIVSQEFGKEHECISYELALTNFEVKRMFEKLVVDWFSQVESHYSEFINALLKDDKKAMNAYMNKVALATFSNFDTGTKPSESTEPERFYHGFVLGMMVDLKEQYEILSNRESGFGRYDVMLVPKQDGLHGIILEFKVFDQTEEETLEDTVAKALKQIEDKCYEATLLEKGLEKEKIYKYGFAFKGKKVLIG